MMILFDIIIISDCMKKTVKNILIIANYTKDNVKDLLGEMTEYFKNKDISVSTCSYNEDLACTVKDNADLAMSLGGDGTLLYTARLISQIDIPILGINLGDFGFITEVSRREWKEAFELYSENKLNVSNRFMVNVEVRRNNELLSSLHGLNDAVISSCGISRMSRLEVFLSNTYVGQYRADGVIVSTPTGSTAYSMAAEGPIMHPEMQAMILNPICPFTLSNRPIVVPGSVVVDVHVEKHQRTDLILTVDGQEVVPLLPEDVITIKQSEYSTQIIHSDKRNFYEILRAKLNWSGAPNA
jgi:NAD+ kinase